MTPCVGQVWRDRDKRSLNGNRHVMVIALVEHRGKPSVRVADCYKTETGWRKHSEQYFQYHVRVDRLPKAFVFVAQEPPQ